MPADLVVFAPEGVLVDSELIVAEARAEVLAAAGLPLPAEELAADYGGLSFKEVLLRLEERAAVPVPASLLAEAEARTDARLKRDLRAVAGAREALGGLGIAFCAASDLPAARLGAMLETAGLLPPLSGRIFSGADAGLRPKPAPDLPRFVLKTTGVAAGRCFAVDAAPAGVEAARAAGMRAIGFSGGSHSDPGLADKLTEAGAETVLRRLSDLRGVLLALGEWSEPA